MSVRTPLALLGFGLVLGLATVGADASAQTATLGEPAPASASASAPASASASMPVPGAAGPRLAARQVGVRTQAVMAATSLATPVPQPAISRKRGVAQMVIGGVVLVGGAIVGGDAGTIVMLAGLGYGIYGLYLYLQ